MIPRLALLACVLAGVSVAAVSGWYALADFHQLRLEQAAWEAAVRAGAEQRELFIAHAAQHLRRINVAAEGCWALLGAILAALGVVGWAITARPAPRE